MAATEDCRKDLVRLRCGEDKLHMWWRFFQRLEQRIEGRRREHVDLVNVVDLVATTRGGEFGVVPQFADLFDAVVTRAVDLEDIEAVPFGDLFADVLVRIEIRTWAIVAVERFSEDTSCRRLTGAARADE